jgi:Ca2+-binding EF-hand superfamily protein
MSSHLISLAGLAVVAAVVACGPTPDSPQARQLQRFGLLEKFDRFDENGDGYLNRRELEAGARQVGVHFTAAEMDQIMIAYDRNRDGRISLHEAQHRAAVGTAGA